MNSRNAVVSFACLFLGVALVTGQDFSIPLSVAEPSGLARVGAPVSGGIPLPEGRFAVDQQFSLFDGEREVPLQALPMVHDGKGGLRWILLDFQADLGANEKKIFTLKAGKGVAAAGRSLVAENTEAALRVDTGPLSFVISKTAPFALFDKVEVAPVGAAGTASGVARQQVINGGAASYVDGFDGERYVAGSPSSVEIEYEGSLRTTIRVRGPFVGDDKNKFHYIARITAWAGRSDVHVKYTLANSNPDHYSYRKVKESSVELTLAGESTGTLVGAGKPLTAGADVWMQQSARVYSAAMHTKDSLGSSPWYSRTPGSKEAGGAVAKSGDADLWVSKGGSDVAEGWLAVAGRGSIMVGDLYFVDDPPRRLEAQKGKLILTGVTEPLEGVASPFSDRTRILFDCSHLSSQYVIDFAAPSGAAALSDANKAAKSRLWVMAEPAWYSETQQLPSGRFGTQADELAVYKSMGLVFNEKEIPRAPAGRAGNVKRWSAGDDNHFTSEQDTLEAFLLMYLRTGSRAYFDAGETWANYFVDLQTWRTDGWRWKDGGGWWAKKGKGGPLGNRPTRAVDPVTGVRNYVLDAYAGKPPFGKPAAGDMFFFANAKACHCHNWGEGLAVWYCLTGDRDAHEALIDTVEQNIDTQRRAFRKEPNKPAVGYSRDFTRSSFLTNAARLVAPDDEFVREASDYLAKVFLTRTDPEPRGFLVSPSKVSMASIQKATGVAGVASMEQHGVTLDESTGELVDSKSGARWKPVQNPHIWMYPPMSRAMDLYYRLTGNEDALDWMIAYGEGVGLVLYQPRHGTLNYGSLMVDFPVKGTALDLTSWMLPEGATTWRGLQIGGATGYQASFLPDVVARAYEHTGHAALRQRAEDYWWFSTHPGTFTRGQQEKVGRWLDVFSSHDETVCSTARLFYHLAHPRAVSEAPSPVQDLSVTRTGGSATISFTAPAASGKAVRYQVKCAERPIVGYSEFLKKFAENQDASVINWWMATNVTGEPGEKTGAPKVKGERETFVVEGVPEAARYFVVRTFDEHGNRSGVSNVAEAR